MGRVRGLQSCGRVGDEGGLLEGREELVAGLGVSEVPLVHQRAPNHRHHHVIQELAEDAGTELMAPDHPPLGGFTLEQLFPGPEHLGDVLRILPPRAA